MVRIAAKSPDFEIIGAEHYYGNATEWSCCSAPVFNENTLVGILNISINVQNHHLHTIGMVEAAAYAAQFDERCLRVRTSLNSHRRMSVTSHPF